MAAEDAPVEGGGAAALAGGVDPLTLPPHGSAVVLDGLPPSATEADVRSFASRAGRVHDLVLERGGKGSARATVTFESRSAAADAVTLLAGLRWRPHGDDAIDADEAEEEEEEAVEPTPRVRVSPAPPTHRVFVGGLDRSLTRAALEAAVRPRVTGLEAVELVASKDAPGTSRGFGFLNFVNGVAAAAALASLSDLTLDGRPVTVSLAEAKDPHPPKPGAGPPAARGVQVSGLPAGVDEETLTRAFSCLGPIERVVVPPPRRAGGGGSTAAVSPADFAFVYFADERAAVAALAAGARGDAPRVRGARVGVAPARAPAGGVGGRKQQAAAQAQSGKTTGAGESVDGGGGGGGRVVSPPHQTPRRAARIRGVRVRAVRATTRCIIGRRRRPPTPGRARARPARRRWRQRPLWRGRPPRGALPLPTPPTAGGSGGSGGCSRCGRLRPGTGGGRGRGSRRARGGCTPTTPTSCRRRLHPPTTTMGRRPPPSWCPCCCPRGRWGTCWRRRAGVEGGGVPPPPFGYGPPMPSPPPPPPPPYYGGGGGGARRAGEAARCPLPALLREGRMEKKGGCAFFVSTRFY